MFQERLYQLRRERGLSQEQLANQVGVSRQAVQKWESGAAQPTLDKLTALAQYFGLTLDELVTGKATEPVSPISPAPPEPQIVVVEAQRMPGRKVAGIVLLCMAFAVVILCPLMGGLLEGLVLCLPFLICGLICYNAKKHPGLWCAWALFLLVDGYLRYATGLSWATVRWTLQWKPSMNYFCLLTAWCQLLCGLGLLAVTVGKLRKGTLEWTQRNNWLFSAGWALFALLNLPFGVWIFQAGEAGGLSVGGLVTFTGWLQDSLRLALLAALLTAALRLRRGRRTA